jgi:hypothetical protein
MSCVEVWYYYWVVGWFGRVRLRVAENAAIANAVWRNWVWREQDAPEVHRLGADGRVPEPGEAGGSRGGTTWWIDRRGRGRQSAGRIVWLSTVTVRSRYQRRDPGAQISDAATPIMDAERPP